MKFKFRKSKKILPGVKLNVTNKGISANIGVKGANIGTGKRGTRANLSVPGTGISGSQKISSKGCMGIVAVPVLLLILAIIGFVLY